MFKENDDLKVVMLRNVGTPVYKLDYHSVGKLRIQFLVYVVLDCTCLSKEKINLTEGTSTFSPGIKKSGGEGARRSMVIWR